MVENMSSLDRIIRAMSVVVIGLLGYLGYIIGGWTLAPGILAAALVLTSIVGYCPIYAFFGFSTTERSPIGR